MSDPLEQLKHLRTEWATFFKWAAGVSISLITVSLAVLAFHNGADIYNKVSAVITTSFLMTNVFLTWLLLLLNVYVVKTTVEFNIRGGMFQSRDEGAKFEKRKKNAKTLEKWVAVFFVLGIASFLGYLITYIR